MTIFTIIPFYSDDVTINRDEIKSFKSYDAAMTYGNETNQVFLIEMNELVE